MSDSQPQYLDGPPSPRPFADLPYRGQVLVISPHSDDELIGPGGCLLRHRDGGDSIHILVLTDGTRSDAASELGADEYREVREQESTEAARQLGATVEFCRFPDGTRAREEDLAVVVPRLCETLERIKPQVVYTPHPGEAHADHHVAAVATRRALGRYSEAVPCLGYEVWSASAADLVVDISGFMAEKQAIARLYRSQTAHTDLEYFFSGLNAYRAVYLAKGARYGEAFVELSAVRPADEETRT